MIKFLVSLLGFFSLFFLPDYYNIKIMDILLLVTFYVSIIMFLSLKRKLNKIYLIGLSVIGIFLLVTVLGAIYNSESYKGILVAFRYLILLFTVFLLLNLDKNILFYFKKAFVLSAFITVLWMILDNFYYYSHGLISINEVVFNNLYNGSHALTNRYLIGNFLLLRASGFGWDPGGIGPALLIAYILNYYNRFFKFKYNWLLIIGMFLTLSKTTIIAFVIFIIYKFLSKKNRILPILFIIIVFFSIFFISFITNGNKNSGTIRHIKYPASISYIVYAPISDLILGYGYRGTGEFFYKYVPWFKNQDFINSFDDAKNKVIESTFTNLFLYGGLIGSIFYFSMILFIIFFGTLEEKSVIIFLMITFIGYTFENIWTNFLIYGYFISLMNLKRRVLDKLYYYKL